MLNEKHLHRYQLAAIDHVIDNTHSALLMQMGLGKTSSTLTAINRLIYDHLDISKVLVIAPRRVSNG